MTVWTLLIAAWFMGDSAINHFDHHQTGSGVFLAVLSALFVIAAIAKQFWYPTAEDEVE